MRNLIIVLLLLSFIGLKAQEQTDKTAIQFTTALGLPNTNSPTINKEGFVNYYTSVKKAAIYNGSVWQYWLTEPLAATLYYPLGSNPAGYLTTASQFFQRSGGIISPLTGTDGFSAASITSSGLISTTAGGNISSSGNLSAIANIIGQAGITLKYTDINNTYSITDAVNYIIDCTSGTFNVTLPSANAGRMFIIKNSGLGLITLNTAGTGGSIEGTTTRTLSQSQSMLLVCVGTNIYKILASNDEQVAYSTTTIGLSKATLNGAFPNVRVGFRLLCPEISLGGAIYTKATENGTNDTWQMTSAPPAM